jgi:hypothetical protein
MALDLLLYYNAVTGEAATGEVDVFGVPRFLQHFTQADGWTHIVATKDRFLYYNSNTTEIATTQIDANGHQRILQQHPADRHAVWTHLASTEDHILFYHADTGRAEIGDVDDAGHYRALNTYTDFALGWTHIAATQNRLLYYNAASTQLATARISPDGQHQFINHYPLGSTLMWTHLTSTQHHFLFYNVEEGGGVTASVDEAGNYIPLEHYPGLSPNWAQLGGTQRYILFYNAQDAVGVTGRILEDGQFQDIAVAADFPQGLTHVCALKTATPLVADVLLNPVVELIRPDDLLNLRIECRNLQLDKSDRTNLVLTATDTAQTAYLIVHFPPQTIAEEAVYEPRKEPTDNLEDDQNRQKTEKPEEKERREMGGGLTQTIGQLLPAKARIAQPSRLVFQLPADSNPRIPYTTEGLLNWTGLELSVSPLAAIPSQPTDEQRITAPPIIPPTDTETALEIPYRLILSPNRDVRWVHASTPKTHAGRTELWHTRLADPAPLRAIWSPDYVATRLIQGPGGSWPTLGKPDEWSGESVLTAMNKRDRHELVILTSAFHGFVSNNILRFDYVPTPVNAEQVMLSALGGWLKSRGNWTPPVQWLDNFEIPIPVRPLPVVEMPPIRLAEPGAGGFAGLLEPILRDPFVGGALLRRPGRKGEPLNISEWVHVATQGRDHYVRIVYEGYLYPFGHRAALIKVTERKFNSVNGEPVAYLAQRMFIVVREPLKAYSVSALDMPLKQVQMTTTVTPDIDLPFAIPGTDYCFWVSVGGKDFKFHAVGKDSAEHHIDFTAALVFVPNSETGKIAVVGAAYNQDAARKACAVPGQAVTFADRDGSASDNTTLITQRLYFDAVINNSTFSPILAKASVNLAAVEQLLGTTLATDIRYYQPYLNTGFDSGNNEVFAELVNKVTANFPADKAGGIATPDLSISCITRKLGAIAGDVKKATDNIFDPKDFFKDVGSTAKLFGDLSLLELIAEGDFNNAPKIQFFPQEVPPAVRLDWKPAIKDVDVGFFQFVTAKVPPESVLEIRGLIEKPVGGGAGKSHFAGTLTNFYLEFFKVVRLNFLSFGFTAETGKKTAVDVRLQPGDDALEFIGDLKFVNELKKIIPPDLFGDGPTLEITPQPAIRAGFAIGLPPVAVGVFALKDVSLGASLTLPFLDGRPLFDFNVSERQHPFNLTIAFFGGGGFFHLQLDTQEVRMVEAAFEFGASACVNLGVASGGVHIMAGIYFKLEKKEVTTTTDGHVLDKPRSINVTVLTGYFRMGGELSVLGFISISLEFLLSFTYQESAGAGKAVGMAKLTVKVEVLFISKSVEITVEKQFGGEAGDPTFIETWTAPELWDEYAGAFA